MKSIKELKMDGVLWEYDGPLLSVYKDEMSGLEYVLIWIDNTDIVNKWILFRPIREVLDSFRCGSIDLRTCMLSGVEFAFVESDHTSWTSQLDVNFNDINEDLIPESGIYL